MNIARDDHQNQESHPTAQRDSRVAGILLKVLRVTIYAVLAVLRPFVVALLSAACVTGIALWLFFGLLVHAPHFPSLFVLVGSTVSAVLIVVYYAALDLLLPE